jgi:hypothetical protein
MAKIPLANRALLEAGVDRAIDAMVECGTPVARVMAIAISPEGAIACSLKPSGSRSEGLELLKMIVSLYEEGVGEIAVASDTTPDGAG